MEQEQHYREEEATEVALDREYVLHDNPVAVSLVAFLLALDLCLNLLKLSLHVRVLGRQFSESEEILKPLFGFPMVDFDKSQSLQIVTSPSLLTQVSGCLWNEGDHQDHQHTGNELNAECYSPLGVVLGYARARPQAHAIVDPER